MPPQVNVEFHSPVEFLPTEITQEWFLSRVATYVCLHISPCEKSFGADWAYKPFDSAVNHLEVLAEDEAVDEALPALLTDVDPTIAMYPVVPFKTL